MCRLYPRGANGDSEMLCLRTCYMFVNHQYWLPAFCLLCQYAFKEPALFFSLPLSYLNSLILQVRVQELVTCFRMSFVFPTWPFQRRCNHDDLQIYVPSVWAISVSLLLFLCVLPLSDLPFTQSSSFYQRSLFFGIYGFSQKSNNLA